MENLRIAVVSPDEAYNRAFCMSLLHSCRQIDATAFTSKQFIRQWADYKGRGAFYDNYDLILWAGDEIRDHYGDNIVYLTDRLSLAGMDYTSSMFSIYKYSPTGTVLASLFDIYSHLTGRGFSLVKRDGVRLFAFASYCGGSGCTTIARSVAQELSRFHGRKVLCICLEDVESAAEFVSVPEGIRSEGEFLYRLLGKGNLPFFDPYLVKDDFGVCSFVPPEGRNPLCELPAEDMRKLISAIMDSGVFDTVVADLSTGLTDAACAIMEAAERVCVTAKTEDTCAREKHYMNQLEADCGEDIKGKVIRAVNIIPKDRGPVDIRAPLEGDFGRDISKLTERLINVLE